LLEHDHPVQFATYTPVAALSITERHTGLEAHAQELLAVLRDVERCEPNLGARSIVQGMRVSLGVRLLMAVSPLDAPAEPMPKRPRAPR
jgi:hypothetical protein